MTNYFQCFRHMSHLSIDSPLITISHWWLSFSLVYECEGERHQLPHRPSFYPKAPGGEEGGGAARPSMRRHAVHPALARRWCSWFLSPLHKPCKCLWYLSSSSFCVMLSQPTLQRTLRALHEGISYHPQIFYMAAPSVWNNVHNISWIVMTLIIDNSHKTKTSSEFFVLCGLFLYGPTKQRYQAP